MLLGIKQAITRQSIGPEERADMLIFTGGLGPTKDDLTKETIASSLDEELVYDEKALTSISDYFKRTGRNYGE